MLMETGEGHTNVITDGFDYERWRRTQDRNERRLVQSAISKEDTVHHLVEFVNERVKKWCLDVDVQEMCLHSHKQLLQLKVIEFINTL